jgi:hypothetical protein
MRKLVLALLLSLWCSSAFAAIPATAAWEVRPTNGNDVSGGCFAFAGPTYDTTMSATNANTASCTVTITNYSFVAGDAPGLLYVKTGTNWIPGFYPITAVAGGSATVTGPIATVASPTVGTWSIDRSQQNSSQFSGSNLVVDASLNTKVTSATHTFTQADVANSVFVTTGTGWTVGPYVVNSVAAGAATLDRSPAAVNTTSGNWALGGAFKTIPNVALYSNNSNICWVKNEQTITTAGMTITTNTMNKIVGYGTARGDSGRTTIQQTSGGVYTLTAAALTLENLVIDGNNVVGAGGVSTLGSGHAIYRNLVIKNCNGKTGLLLQSAGDNAVIDCEFTGGGSSAFPSIDMSSSTLGTIVTRCWIHDNACPGIGCGTNGDAVVTFCLLSNNTGASVDGIYSLGAASAALNNTLYNTGRDGISLTGGREHVRNNVITKCGRYGINSSLTLPPYQYWDGNGFWNNTSGDRNNMDDATAATYGIYKAYTNVLDQHLSVDPFMGAASNDFRPNTAATGGNMLRARGTPGTFTNGPAALVGYLDMGAVQHRDPPINRAMGVPGDPRQQRPFGEAVREMLATIKR